MKSPYLKPLGSNRLRTVSRHRTVSALVLDEGITPKSVFSTAELMAESEHTSATPDSNGEETQSSGTGRFALAALAVTNTVVSGNNIVNVAVVLNVVTAIVFVDGGFRLFISVSSHERFVFIFVREEESGGEVVDFSVVLRRPRSLLIVAAVCKRMGAGEI